MTDERSQPNRFDAPLNAVDQVRARWLASSAETGAPKGAVAELALPPGAGYQIHRYEECERTVVVLDGDGQHLGDGGAVAVRPLDAVFVPRSSWHGFANTGTRTARLIVVYAGHPDPAHLRPQTLDDPARNAAGPRPSWNRLPHLPPVVMSEEEGFVGVRSALYVNSELNGARETVAGFTRFEPSGTHRLHRHAEADEAFVLIDGHDCWQTGPTQARAICPGELAFAPAGEWHGFWNRGDRQATALFFYLGASAVGKDGYELFRL